MRYLDQSNIASAARATCSNALRFDRNSESHALYVSSCSLETDMAAQWSYAVSGLLHTLSVYRLVRVMPEEDILPSMKSNVL